MQEELLLKSLHQITFSEDITGHDILCSISDYFIVVHTIENETMVWLLEGVELPTRVTCEFWAVLGTYSATLTILSVFAFTCIVYCGIKHEAALLL